MYEWQKDLLNGITKGNMPIIAMGRQTGKSMFWKYMMEQQIIFTGSWSDWKKHNKYVWPWNRKISIDGKKIWGHINMRYNKIMINRGGRMIEYATDTEVFKKCLKDGGQGW